MLHDNRRADLAKALWRYIGRPLATIAIGILVTLAIVRGESWAIRQAPLLNDGSITVSADAGCIPDEPDTSGALPVAILH